MAKQKVTPKSKAKTAYGLLSEVCDVIRNEPLRYNQTWWLSKRRDRIQVLPPAGYPSCGTVGCVAGWAVTLKGKTVRDWDIESTARKLLGLDEAQATDLFSSDAIKSTDPQTLAHANAGIAHIRSFQKEYAKQLKATRV